MTNQKNSYNSSFVPMSPATPLVSPDPQQAKKIQQLKEKIAVAQKEGQDLKQALLKSIDRAKATQVLKSITKKP